VEHRGSGERTRKVLLIGRVGKNQYLLELLGVYHGSRVEAACGSADSSASDHAAVEPEMKLKSVIEQVYGR
jgi:hypothetical protein